MIENNNRKRVLFRADGDSVIGLGHIYRCLAIAERVNVYFDCYFAIKNSSNKLIKIISKLCTPIILEQFKSYSYEAEKLAADIITQYKIDIIVLDGYSFDTSYQKIIKKKSKSILISIDDDQPFHYVSDVVINHAGGVSKEQISKEDYTKLFLGYNYLLLRKEFIQAFNTVRKISGINSVLICFGGADPHDITGQILNCLKHEKYIRKIIIVIGASYLKLKELEKSIDGYNHVEIKSNIGVKEMVLTMSNVDLAIVPSSTIGLEAFASKMILITGMTARNQKNIYNGLIKEKNVVGIGDFNTLNCPNLLQNITNIASKFNNYTFNSEDKLNDNIVSLFKSLL